jgi:ATP-binding region ATPase domain protein
MAINYDKENKKIKKLQLTIKQQEQELSELKTKVDSIANLKHETSRLNAEILARAEELHTLISEWRGEKDIRRISDLSNTIFHTASIISSRIIYSEMEMNPDILDEQEKFTSVIYKKFDKARRVLSKEAESKKIKIKFEGNSNYAIKAINAFDCVPFIILDNAIKYSPKNQSVEINFNESQNDLEVIVSSMGPSVSKNNISHLCERGFRDPNTKNVSGQGLGLYIAKNLCDLHNIKLEVESDSSRGNANIDNIQYCFFVVKLKLIK